MGDRRLYAWDIVQHFKRENLSKKDRDKNIYLYKIVGIAKHTETKKMVVVYQSLYGDFGMYVRPYDMRVSSRQAVMLAWTFAEKRDTERSEVFIGKVDKEKYPDIKQVYRFEKVKEEVED